MFKITADCADVFQASNIKISGMISKALLRISAISRVLSKMQKLPGLNNLFDWRDLQPCLHRRTGIYPP
jgi:hypothetical protein